MVERLVNVVIRIQQWLSGKVAHKLEIEPTPVCYLLNQSCQTFFINKPYFFRGERHPKELSSHDPYKASL